MEENLGSNTNKRKVRLQTSEHGGKDKGGRTEKQRKKGGKGAELSSPIQNHVCSPSELQESLLSSPLLCLDQRECYQASCLLHQVRGGDLKNTVNI